MINGKLRQVMFSARELVPASLPSRIWINEHLSYTHGYGLCMGPVNNVTGEGLPDFFIENIPPVSNAGVSVTRPEIYYGETDAGYSIVNTRSKEFDYPSGDSTRPTTLARRPRRQGSPSGRRSSERSIPTACSRPKSALDVPATLEPRISPASPI
jgi:uncharacterized membrane protein (UPF0182 family)